jgi:hypothetical protein
MAHSAIVNSKPGPLYAAAMGFSAESSKATPGLSRTRRTVLPLPSNNPASSGKLVPWEKLAHRRTSSEFGNRTDAARKPRAI